MINVKNKGFMPVHPVVDYSVRALCIKPYYNHPKGCPNYDNKRLDCPPYAPLFIDWCNYSYPIYLIWNRFDLLAHVERMRKKHSDWTDRQLYCCLYWQGTARSQLKKTCAEFLERYPSYTVSYVPEAMGINVTETAKELGIILEWPPRNYAYQIAIAGELI